MTAPASPTPGLAKEIALLAVLATLWGASYTFIKIGVETIPPITFIAARTLIAGGLLLVIIKLRGTVAATGSGHLEAVPDSGLHQQRHPVHPDRLGGTDSRCRAGDDPQLDNADLRIPADGSDHPP